MKSLMGFVKSVLSMKKPKNSLKIGDWHEIADLFRIMHAGARAQHANPSKRGVATHISVFF